MNDPAKDAKDLLDLTGQINKEIREFQKTAVKMVAFQAVLLKEYDKAGVPRDVAIQLIGIMFGKK